MKKRIYLMMAAPALLMASCSQEENPQLPVNSGEIVVQASVEGMESATRAVNQTWDAGEQIGVSMISRGSGTAPGAEHKNKLYKISNGAGGTSATFTADDANKIYFDDNSEWTFAAYSPYMSTDSKTVTTSDNPTLKTNDIIVARGAKATHNPGASAKPEVKFTGAAAFKHVMSKVILKLKAGTGVTAEEFNNYKCFLNGLKHTTTFTVPNKDNGGTELAAPATATTAIASWIFKGEAETGATRATTQPNLGNADVNKVRTFADMFFIPQTIAKIGFVIKRTVGSSTETLQCDINVPDGKLTAGNQYTIEITVNQTDINVTGCTIDAWTNKNVNASAY